MPRGSCSLRPGRRGPVARGGGLSVMARRADPALEAIVDDAVTRFAMLPWRDGAPIELLTAPFSELPDELALRVLGRAITLVGNEGPVELGKLEALHAGLIASPAAVRFRRTLAGAVVTRSGDRLTV